MRIFNFGDRCLYHDDMDGTQHQVVVISVLDNSLIETVDADFTVRHVQQKQLLQCDDEWVARGAERNKNRRYTRYVLYYGNVVKCRGTIKEIGKKMNMSYAQLLGFTKQANWTRNIGSPNWVLLRDHISDYEIISFIKGDPYLYNKTTKVIINETVSAPASELSFISVTDELRGVTFDAFVSLLQRIDFNKPQRVYQLIRNHQVVAEGSMDEISHKTGVSKSSLSAYLSRNVGVAGKEHLTRLVRIR